MTLLQKRLSAAAVCLPSFTKRLICVVCALLILLSYVTISVTAKVTGDTADLTEMSFELSPDGGEDVTVTLNGMMPQTASAEAVDVTADYADYDSFASDKLPFESADVRSVIGAYDITITDGAKEYQPAEGYPIHVEISAPAISDSSKLTVIHIADNGDSEPVEHFTVEDGKVSFYATGFSIYEIVELTPGPESSDIATAVADLTAQRGQMSGFKLYYGNPPMYFTSGLNGNNALVETQDASEAAVWFFEQDGNNVKLYTYVGGVKKYLHNKSGNIVELSETAADSLEISTADTSPQSFYIKQNNTNKWLQHSGSGSGIRYWTDNKNAANSQIYMQYAVPAMDASVISQLDGQSYGLFHYTEGSTTGNALMAQGDTHSLIKLVLTAANNNRTLYVDENNEIDRWQFHYDETDNAFLISVNSSSGTQYLCADSSGISTTASLEDASRFTVNTVSNPDGTTCVRLFANGVYVTYQPRPQDEGGSRFSVTTNPSDSFTMLRLLDRASMEETDLITFSADRVSVSDIPRKIPCPAACG